MGAEQFFEIMTMVSDWIFSMCRRAWGVVQDNWLLCLSFAVFLVSLFVLIIRRIRNIKG